MTNLRHLDLESRPSPGTYYLMNHDISKEVLMSLTRLTWLNLTRTTRYDDETLVPLTSLRTLNLARSTGIEGGSLHLLKNLTELDITSTTLLPDNLTALAQLRTLNWSEPTDQDPRRAGSQSSCSLFRSSH